MIVIVLEGIVSKNFVKHSGMNIEINNDKVQTENALTIFSYVFLKPFFRNMYTAYAMKGMYNVIIAIRDLNIKHAENKTAKIHIGIKNSFKNFLLI